jgi:hypothetical protein
MSPARPNATTAAEMRRHQRLRQELRELIAEQQIWTDLLRHKAHALRAVADAVQLHRLQPPPTRGSDSVEPLEGGTLDPYALADALTASHRSSLHAADRRSQPRAVVDNTEDTIREAQTVWDTVADPQDWQACQDLAETADRVADRLENATHDARNQLRSSGAELARLLTRTRREADPRDH